MKRILLALALLPALSLPALAEEAEIKNFQRIGTRVATTINTVCSPTREGTLVYSKKHKAFVFCDGNDWHKLTVGEVIKPESNNTTEGEK